MVGETLNQLDEISCVDFTRDEDTNLGLAAGSTERASLALELEIWQAASSVEGGLVGGVGGLCGPDAGDVKGTTGRRSSSVLLGEQAQGAEGG